MFGTANTSIKKRLHIQYWGLSLLAMTLFSCQPQGSGPCDYDKEIYVKAEVLEVEPLGDDKFEVWLEFNKSILGKEKQALSDLREVTINRAFLEANRIQPGIIYTGYVTELKSGDCQPYYLSFEAEFKTP